MILRTARLDGPRIAAQNTKPGYLVVFLHGYGADGGDLIDIGKQWKSLLPDASFVSPHAPQPCSVSLQGRQWFPLTMRDETERWRGVNLAEAELQSFLDAELNALGLDDSKLALVGFSQGAMMALHVGLRRKVPPAAIVGYSGILIEPYAGQVMGSVVRPPVLLVHGDRDEVIPVRALSASSASLKALNIDCTTHVCHNVGHGIDADGLLLGASFISKHFT